MREPGYAFDTTYFPLVVVRSPERVDEDAVRGMFESIDGLYRARQRYAFVMDTRATRELPSAKARKLLGEVTKATSAEARQWCVGVAIVVDSPLVRGVLTAVGWIVTPATPTVHVPTLPEAVAWCCAQLEAANIEVPLATRQYRMSLFVDVAEAARSGDLRK
jgi:hypothetical protein